VPPEPLTLVMTGERLSTALLAGNFGFAVSPGAGYAEVKLLVSRTRKSKIILHVDGNGVYRDFAQERAFARQLFAKYHENR
jgi:hypothetical protein